MNPSNLPADTGSIRELNADELDSVGGGFAPLAALGLMLAGAVATGLGEVVAAGAHWIVKHLEQ